MAEYDGEIRIKATIDTDEFDKKASNLTKKLYSQNNALKRQQYILSELNQKYSDIVNKITKTAEETSLEKSLKRAEKELSLFQKQYENAIKHAEPLRLVKRSYENLGLEPHPDYKVNIEKAESDVLKFKGQIESTNSEIKRLQKELEKVRLNPENTRSAKDLEYKISLAQEKAGNLRDRIHETNQALNNIRSDKVSKMSESFSRLSDTLKSKFQNISSLFGRTFSAAISSVSSPLRSLIRGFERLGRRILRLSGLVLVFNVIRSSLRGLRDYLGGVLQTNDVFIKSLGQIKSNLMTAFYPVYQYILPALNALMGTLVKASAYLAQFMSMIFGKNTHESQKGAKILNDQALAVKNQKKSYDELGKSIKKAKGELASFDKLIVLSQNNQKKPKSPADSGFVFSPTTSFDNNFNTISNIFDVLREKIKPTVEAFKNLGETINNTFGSFAVTLGKDFYNEFLKPLGEWTLGRGLPEFARITEDMFKNIDWNRLNAEFKDLFKALEPFSETIGEGLLWFYEHIISKIATWTISEALPRALSTLSSGITILDNVLKGVGDVFKWFFDNVIKDIAGFSADTFLSFWDKFNEKLKEISGNTGTLQLVGRGVGAIIAILAGAQIGLAEIGIGILAKKAIEFENSLSSSKKAFDEFLKDINVSQEKWDNLSISEKNRLIKEWLDSDRKLEKEEDKQREEFIRKELEKYKDLRTANEKFNDMVEKNKKAIDQWGSEVSENFKKSFTESKNFIIEKWNEFSPKFTEFGIRLGDSFKEGILSAVRGGLRSMQNFINDMIKKINAVIGFARMLPGADWIKTIPEISIPGLAQGAVLRGGNPMIAYLNDQPQIS
ncbi:hypothetical protein M9Y10_004566 [Tritrichomonas musculus]|uniref:Uncharacterized protein n=1 Tax=Tritrichomonas musculus TaxID=1915356 RepID=A0ABR2GNH2_9EUKA